jgi:hypothetical protein
MLKELDLASNAIRGGACPLAEALIAATHARYTHLSKVWTGLQ